MWLYRLWVLIALFCASCGGGSGKVVRIAMDPTWYPVNFGSQQPYVNGFVDELLLDMAQSSGVTFERFAASGSALYDGLQADKYDAVISSLEPYVFNTAQYAFSQNILSLGPVLVAPVDHSVQLQKMKGALVGMVEQDPARLVLEQNPTLVLRNFESVPDLLNAVVRGEIEAAVLDHYIAARYVADLYSGVLQIASAPLNQAGLHFVTLKDSSVSAALNRSLQRLEKKKRLSALLKKWQLN